MIFCANFCTSSFNHLVYVEPMYIEHMHTWNNLGEKYISKSLIQLFSSQNKRQLGIYERIQFSASSIIYETKFTPKIFFLQSFQEWIWV